MKERPPWLLERAAASPEAPALEVGAERLCFAELAARVGALAAALRERGVGPGDTVAALVPDGLPGALLVHAVALRGATLLPLHRRVTARELGTPLREGDARLLVHGAGELAERAQSAAATAPDLALEPLETLVEEAARRPASAAASPPLDPEAICGVLFTSGTTGAPKGAELSYGSFEASALASALHLGVLPRDRWLSCLPLHHVGGLSILVRGVLQGTTVVVHERFDPEAVARALEREGISVVSLVPTMLARLLEVRGERRAPEPLRCVLLGGAAAPAELLRRARHLGYPLAPSYGLTEACSQVATRRLEDDTSPLGAGLAPLVGTALRIAREQGGPAPPGEPGEIQVRSPTVMRGYRNRPEASAAALRDGWLCTGDIGVFDASGRLRVLDRRSDLVVSGGENVYPAELEAMLETHPAVREAGVAGVPDAEFGSRPAAWLVARGEPPSEAVLRAFCRERVAAFKVPVAYTFVRELPRNASGKLLRRALPGLTATGPAEDPACPSP